MLPIVFIQNKFWMYFKCYVNIVCTETLDLEVESYLFNIVTGRPFVLPYIIITVNRTFLTDVQLYPSKIAGILRHNMRITLFAAQYILNKQHRYCNSE